MRNSQKMEALQEEPNRFTLHSLRVTSKGASRLPRFSRKERR